MKTDKLLVLLQELVYARGPCGQEGEVKVICQRELGKYADKVWMDEAGNVIGLIRAQARGRKSQTEMPAIRVMAHMDEIGMIVKRIDANGTLRVNNLGGLKPGYLGQCPVDILADSEILPGVLSIGSLHTSAETANVEETRTKAIDWDHVHVFTNKTEEELKKKGVHPGTRVVIARERRKLFTIGNCVGGYFMDDRAAITVSLAAAALLRDGKRRVTHDIYFAMTIEEERGGIGAAYALRKLPGDVTIAIEIGPIAEEYKTEFRDDPIVAYSDGRALYSKPLADRLVARARALGMNPQTAVWSRLGTDASIAKSLGHAAQIGLICIPTQNTHGFEIIFCESLLKCAKLLADFLCEPVIIQSG